MRTRKQLSLAVISGSDAPAPAPIRTISALRQGPSLRRLLGSAGDLWEQLQLRARRAHSAAFTVKIRELALTQRPPRPQRTIEWGLQRLVAAGVIQRQRSRYGVTITVLAHDVDDNGVREYSPRLTATTIAWIRTRSRRGRPKQKQPSTEHARTFRAAENARMQASTEPCTADTPRILSHPLIPPNPYTPALSLPRTPMPHLLELDARPSERREFLIEAYVSAARVFWPTYAVKNAVMFLRSRDGRRLLDAAADIFMRNGIAPQAWLGTQFERVQGKRKQPLRPEHIYEPSLIEKHAGVFVSSVHATAFYMHRVTAEPRYERYVRGVRELCALWERTMRDLRALSRADDDSITQIVQRDWPHGFEQVYHSAEAKMGAIRNELEVRVARGDYIWGE